VEQPFEESDRRSIIVVVNQLYITAQRIRYELIEWFQTLSFCLAYQPVVKLYCGARKLNIVGLVLFGEFEELPYLIFPLERNIRKRTTYEFGVAICLEVVL